jgi:hypothetical protein
MIQPTLVGGTKKKVDRDKCATGNGSAKKRAKAQNQILKGGKFVKKEVEELPADFPNRILILAITARCSPSDSSRILPATMPWEDGTEAAWLFYL